ncbi:hypothetical protein MBLNU459_g5168t2 [Dothideomycetes sp. NU459]
MVVSSSVYVCPANNGQLVTDNNGALYTLGCGNDTTQNSQTSDYVPHSFNDCFSYCDQTTGCDGFTYVGGTNGSGAGYCYFKSNYVSLSLAPGGPDLVAAIRASPATVSPTATATPVPACPYANGTLQTDANGQQYNVFCYYDTTAQAYSSNTSSTSYNECFAYCDATKLSKQHCYDLDIVGCIGELLECLIIILALNNVIHWGYDTVNHDNDNDNDNDKLIYDIFVLSVFRRIVFKLRIILAVLYVGVVTNPDDFKLQQYLIFLYDTILQFGFFLHVGFIEPDHYELK